VDALSPTADLSAVKRRIPAALVLQLLALTVRARYPEGEAPKARRPQDVEAAYAYPEVTEELLDEAREALRKADGIRTAVVAHLPPAAIP